MQTFLPYADYIKTAKVLDRERLGKQRSECKQIFNALYTGGGWRQHPAVRMWRGYGGQLYLYYSVICSEWIRRGYRHTQVIANEIILKAQAETQVPPWLGYEALHRSHRSNLMRKNPEHYGVYFREDQMVYHANEGEYIWPVDKQGRCTCTNSRLTEPVL